MAPRHRRIVSSPEPEDLPSSNVQERDLDNVSGSNEPAAPSDRVDVNNPDIAPTLPKSSSDVQYFFDKSGDKAVCKECR
jgi:hypothetical protein